MEKIKNQTVTHGIFVVYMQYITMMVMHYLQRAQKSFLTKRNFLSPRRNTILCAYCLKQDQLSHCSPNQVNAQERAQLWKATARPPTGSSVLKYISSMYKFSVYVPTVPTTTCREAFLLFTERIIRYLSWAKRIHIRLRARNNF